MGTPTTHEAGRFTQLLFLHEADRVREAPVAAGDDQFGPIEPDFVDE